jgi:predicted amidohydrolase YtcJ
MKSLALLVLCGAAAGAQEGSRADGAEGPADLVVRGRIFTGAGDAPRAEALAVRGATIAAVGSRAQIEPWIGPGTRVIDAGEGSVLPGFNDAHCHFTVGFGLQSDVDLLDAHGLDEILARVAAYARAHPEDEVIDGMGWDLADMPAESFPTAAQLDALVEDRAVLLWSEGPHAVWVNSRALERARIDGETRLPPGVTALRDASGEPTGCFLGRGLLGLFLFAPLPDLAAMKAAIRRGLGEAARCGLTSVQDPVPSFLLPFLAELHDADELTLRFHVWGGLTRGPFGGGVAETLALAREHARADWISFGTLKGGVDGMPSLRSAALFVPYADDPGARGVASSDPARLAAAVREAHAAGMRVALHATGDAGVRAAIDAFLGDPRPGLRDRVEHAFLLDAADVPRLAAAGTIVSVQPSFLARDLAQGGVYERRFGAERCARVLPLRALQDAGVTLAFGTDFSLNALDPRQGLAAAVARQTSGGEPSGGWHPEQRLTLAEALRAYTLGSALAEGAEDRKGTLEPGKLADIAVFARDLFTLEPSALPAAELLATVVGGRVVYAR